MISNKNYIQKFQLLRPEASDVKAWYAIKVEHAPFMQNLRTI
jgi:hypothetical protein